MILNDSVHFGFVIGERIKLLKLDMETIELKQDPLLAVLSPSNPLTDSGFFDLKNFDKVDFLSFEERNGNFVLQNLNSLNIYPNVRQRVYDDQVILSMVEKNLGVSILPKMLVDESKNYQVKALTLNPSLNRSICLAYKNYASLPRMPKLFLHYIANYFLKEK